MATATLSIFLVMISLVVYVNGNYCLTHDMMDDDIVEILLKESDYCFGYYDTIRVYCNHTSFYLYNLNRSEDLITSTKVILNVSVTYIAPLTFTRYCPPLYYPILNQMSLRFHYW